jgi:hypothetical protein
LYELGNLLKGFGRIITREAISE